MNGCVTYPKSALLTYLQVSRKDEQPMGLISRLQATAKRVVTLPVISDRVLEDAKLERSLAQAGVVPKRCGLCRSFSAQDMKDTQTMNPAFAVAMGLVPPGVMGALKGAKKPVVGSEAARALRPDLSNRWEDYGGCTKYPGLGVWGFDEAPKIPAEFASGTVAPCKWWR